MVVRSCAWFTDLVRTRPPPVPSAHSPTLSRSVCTERGGPRRTEARVRHRSIPLRGRCPRPPHSSPSVSTKRAVPGRVPAVGFAVKTQNGCPRVGPGRGKGSRFGSRRVFGEGDIGAGQRDAVPGRVRPHQAQPQSVPASPSRSTASDGERAVSTRGTGAAETASGVLRPPVICHCPGFSRVESPTAENTASRQWPGTLRLRQSADWLHELTGTTSGGETVTGRGAVSVAARP
jgi:hypothetical protein